LRDLAVAAGALDPDLFAGGKEAADHSCPPQRRPTFADVADHVAHRCHTVAPIDGLALAAGDGHLVADHLGEAVRVGGAADEGEEGEIIDIPEGRFVEPGGFAEADGDDAGTDGPLHRHAGAEIGGERKGRDQLGQTHRFRRLSSRLDAHLNSSVWAALYRLWAHRELGPVSAC
jgi:hypothetical protein